MRRRVLLASVGGAALVGLLAVGCGGSGSSQTSSTSTPTAGAVSSTTAPGFSGSANSTYCNLARQFSQTINPNLSSDPKVLFQQFDSLAQQFLATVPSQIKADAQTVIDAIRMIEASFKAVNYDVTKLGPTALAPVQDPKFTAATTRIDDYDTQVCGIAPPTT